MDVLQLFWVIIYGYLFFWCAYLFVFAIGGVFYNKPKRSHISSQSNFAILVPAYKEDAIILSTVEENLKINFQASRFKIFVIADSLQQKTLELLKKMPIELIQVSFINSTKAKAINAALPIVQQEEFSHVVVLDADNVMAPDFLDCVDHSIIKDNGNTAIQAHRLAKNTNSTIALLDAINEEIGNNIFRKGHVSLGFSSALIGSGMIFSTALYERLMASISYVAIEDKMLEFTLLKENIKVSYLDSAFVYDEKVVRQEQFTGQRSRWISNRLYFLKSEAYTSFLKLARLDFDYFDKWLQALIPQKIMLINYVLLFSLASFIFSNNILPVLLLLIILLVTFGISIPKRYYNLRLFNALLGIPFLAYRMMGILLKISKVDPSKFNVTVKEVKS